ncbi:MAG: 3'-5' exonuclease [Verrucomicrobiota bacterium]
MGVTSEVEPRFWREAREVGFDSVFAMDFEGGDQTGVIEFGIVGISREGLSLFSSGFCSAVSAIPEREFQTHGLTNTDLLDARPFGDFWELFRDLRKRGPFLAHSAQVEDRFLRRQWPTPGEVPDWSSKESLSIEWGPWLDSCRVYRSLRPGQAAGLESLITSEGLGEHLDGVAQRECEVGRCRWHAALFDAIASALLFQRAVRMQPDWGVRRFFHESQGGSLEEQSTFGFG